MFSNVPPRIDIEKSSMLGFGLRESLMALAAFLLVVLAWITFDSFSVRIGLSIALAIAYVVVAFFRFNGERHLEEWVKDMLVFSLRVRHFRRGAVELTGLAGEMNVRPLWSIFRPGDAPAAIPLQRARRGKLSSMGLPAKADRLTPRELYVELLRLVATAERMQIRDLRQLACPPYYSKRSFYELLAVLKANGLVRYGRKKEIFLSKEYPAVMALLSKRELAILPEPQKRLS